jgi:hypothetical protein
MDERDDDIIDRFEGEQGLVDVLHAIGVGDNERDKIVDDGLESTEVLVDQFENDINGFTGYIKAINKAFGSTQDEDRRVFFPPTVTSRCIGLLHYASVAYYCYHLIPDLENVMPTLSMSYYKIYKNLSKKEEVEADDDVKLKVPDFKGASTWRSFRDQVCMKLKSMKSNFGYSLDYVIDTTPRPFRRANALRRTTDVVDISKEEFKRRCVHFGETFKEDNSKV